METGLVILGIIALMIIRNIIIINYRKHKKKK